MIGHKFGDRIVIGYGRVDNNKRQYFVCKCKCGFIGEVMERYIKKNISQRCVQCSLKKRHPKKSRNGNTYNNLTIVDYVGSRQRKQLHKALCSCGNEIIAFGFDIQNGKRKRCSMECPELLLIGKKFGDWTVLSIDKDRPERKGFRFYECECICGKKQSVRSANLLSDKSHGCRSCANRKRKLK